MKLSRLLQESNKKIAYKCPCCGRVYGEVPLSFGSEFPDYYYAVPPEERAERIQMEQSLCAVDKVRFFHRGRLTIPIHNNSESLIFDVWTTISEYNFDKRIAFWNNPSRVNSGPYFGWLQTYVPTYGDTFNINTIAIEQEVGLIPEIKVTEENHPLKVDQENGITYKKALEIVELILREQHQKI